VGAAALEAIRQIYADVYFMGVTGVHAEAGLTTGDYEEAKIKLALSQQAAETYVMASGEKLGAASTYLIAPLNAVTGLVVDRSVPDETLRLYQDMGLVIRQTN
ncbi:MAG: DeoR family transcriptional regulator, partial [Chloroflexota bacterium]